MALNTNSSVSGSSTGSADACPMNPINSDCLDSGRIRDFMQPETARKLRQISLLERTDSTNSAILRLPGDRQHAHVVLAEQQTAGRGRRERSWHSPAGGNIYLSLGWWFRESEWPLSTLPLLAAIAVCRALELAGLEGHGIKWPNDVLVSGKKLAGILAELKSSGSGPALAVIGVGLNVRMPCAEPDELKAVIDRPWTDLDSLLGASDTGIGRNRMTAFLLDALVEALELFEQEGFEAFSEAWRDWDVLRGRTIQLEHHGAVVEGVAQGVDHNGGLILQCAGSGQNVFHSGEVSVRRD
jgi:BirA family biotin operon repressor/biotin-[acetyl-CoA-carboxylase] ligase